MALKRQRRNKGEGSISRTPSGRYKATITIGVGIDGKQKRKTITRDTKREVIEAMAQLKATYGLSGTGKTPTTKKNLKDICEDFLEFKSTQLSASTLRMYRMMCNTLIRSFGASMLMENITKTMIEEHFTRGIKDKRIAVSTLKLRKTVWATIFSFALKRNYITENVFKEAEISFPRVAPKASTMILPTPEEFERLVECAMKRQQWCGVIIYLASVTGMRSGELRGLKWNAIDRDNKTITINNQLGFNDADAPLKTPSSYRTIHVTPKAFEMLDTLQHTSEYVFSTPRHPQNPVPYKTLSFLNSIVFKEAGMPEGMTFHDIRHYHATQLLKHGINAKVVSRRLGHTNIVTTLNLYFNYLPSMDEEASTIMD